MTKSMSANTVIQTSAYFQLELGWGILASHTLTPSRSRLFPQTDEGAVRVDIIVSSQAFRALRKKWLMLRHSEQLKLNWSLLDVAADASLPLISPHLAVTSEDCRRRHCLKISCSELRKTLIRWGENQGSTLSKGDVKWRIAP